MSDERYDRSADMRLLELQRQALGVPRRVIESISYTDPEALTDGSKDDDESYVQSGTILVAATDARPRTALIPGALVTVSLSVANDGDAPATDVRLCLPLPLDTAYRPGTLAIDGTLGSDEVANELFGNGVDLGQIEPGARSSVTLRLVVEAGSKDIILSPQLSAASGAIIGLRALRLTREDRSALGVTVERPFYESDEDEHELEPLPPATPQPTITILQPREYPPLVPPAATLVEPIISLAAKTDAPAAPKPVAPVESRPAPLVVKPVAPVATKPVAPVAAKTIPAVASKPVQPAIAKPLPPAPAKPTPSVAAKPVPALTVKAIEPIVARAAPSTVAKPTVPTAKPSPPSVSAKAVTKHVSEPKPPAKPRAKPKPKAKSKAVLQLVEPTQRPKIEVVRSIDDRISFAAQGGPILAVRIDRRRLATLTGLFSGASLGMIAHYLVLNALAARDPLPGDGTDRSIAAFVASQEQLLSRALIATRLGKIPASDSVGAALPAFPPALATHADRRAIDTPPPGEAMLFRAFQPSEVLFVQRMLSNDNAAPFMRAAQLFIGLCANDVALADEPERHRVAVALTAYAALATAEISRIFLSAQGNGTPALFKATESGFDDAARTVLAALARSIE